MSVNKPFHSLVSKIVLVLMHHKLIVSEYWVGFSLDQGSTCISLLVS